MAAGQDTRLESAFYLGYSKILGKKLVEICRMENPKANMISPRGELIERHTMELSPKEWNRFLKEGHVNLDGIYAYEKYARKAIQEIGRKEAVDAWVEEIKTMNNLKPEDIAIYLRDHCPWGKVKNTDVELLFELRSLMRDREMIALECE